MKDQPISIIALGEGFAVIDKPSGLLSIPGRSVHDSVQTRLIELVPGAHGPLIAHRLDRDVSGLMVVGLTPDDHRQLSLAFAGRRVEKFYEAELSVGVQQPSGHISLALRGDPDCRPRQVVDPVRGRPARTEWWALSPTRLRLRPREGRTHQLRVHLAYGLKAPIAGDDLYGGQSAARLMLHATQLTFPIPRDGTPKTYSSPCPF